jgi:hypothetical protein
VGGRRVLFSAGDIGRVHNRGAMVCVLRITVGLWEEYPRRR